MEKMISVLCDALKINIGTLAKKVKTSVSNLYSINSNRRDISEELINKICTKYPKVDRRFFTEEGIPPIPGMELPEKVMFASDIKTPGGRIRFIRKAHNLTQSKFAELLGSNYHQVSAIEFDRQFPRFEFLIKMKEKGFINCFDEIIDGSPDPNQEVVKLKTKVTELEKKLKSLELEYEKFRKMALKSV